MAQKMQYIWLMRKLTLIALVSLLATSCQKQYCYKCESTGLISGVVIKSSLNTVCGMTEKQKERYEKENTTVVPMDNNDVYTSLMLCNKDE